MNPGRFGLIGGLDRPTIRLTGSHNRPILRGLSAHIIYLVKRQRLKAAFEKFRMGLWDAIHKQAHIHRDTKYVTKTVLIILQKEDSVTLVKLPASVNGDTIRCPSRSTQFGVSVVLMLTIFVLSFAVKQTSRHQYTIRI